MNIDQCEKMVKKILAKARAESPGLCARLLTAHAASLGKIQYILAANEPMPPRKAALLLEYAHRRANGEPLAYILGKREFYGLDFFVTPATLIPRPETELLIDLALASFSPEQPVALADIGCGSGCIGLTLRKFRPRWRALLLDNSMAALCVAERNAHLHGCGAFFVCGDIWAAPLADCAFDMIVSNPPYISRAEIADVAAETLAYEPHCALFSPEGGLAHINAVCRMAARCLKDNGLILLEHGAAQRREVEKLLADTGFTDIRLENDLAGRERCAMARKPAGA